MECPWNYSLHLFVLRVTHHCKGLPASCLAISENSSIVSFEYTFYQRKCTLFVNLWLARFLCKHTIKCKYLCCIWVISWKCRIKCNRSCCLIDLQAAFTLSFFFSWVHGANSDHDFYTFSTHVFTLSKWYCYLLVCFSFVSLEFPFCFS